MSDNEDKGMLSDSGNNIVQKPTESSRMSQTSDYTAKKKTKERRSSKVELAESSKSYDSKQSSSSRQPESDDDDKTESRPKPVVWNKVEPKYEPRFAHFKYNMTEGVKWDTAYYKQHRTRVATVKPIVDTKPPPVFSHIYCNMKKLKQEQDRQDEIERGNKRLLEKLVHAMTTTRVDNWNSLEHRNCSSSRNKQHRDVMQVAQENKKIHRRIEHRQSTLKFDVDRCSDSSKGQR